MCNVVHQGAVKLYGVMGKKVEKMFKEVTAVVSTGLCPN